MTLPEAKLSIKLRCVKKLCWEAKSRDIREFCGILNGMNKFVVISIYAVVIIGIVIVGFALDTYFR